MRVMRRCVDVARRLEADCSGIAVEARVKADGKPAAANAQLLLPRDWRRGRCYLLVESDRDCEVEVTSPLLSGKLGAEDLLSGQKWRSEGAVTLTLAPPDRLYRPAGGLRIVLLEKLDARS